MSTELYVAAQQTPEGWNLVSFDEFKDTLAGPFETLEQLEIARKDLGLKLRPLGKAAKTVADMQPGFLFRVEEFWYRLVSWIPGNKNALVTVVGEGRTENMLLKTKVTEVSVLSLK